MSHYKGLVKIADLAHELDNMSQSANDKFKVLCFWDKHGLQATIDAFGITRRTLYYWRSKLKAGGKVTLNDKSRAPIVKRKKINRVKVIRKPKDFKADYPGHCVALDTIEKRIQGSKRYILTFVDLYTRFTFAYATDKHTTAQASQFLTNVKLLFPYKMKHVLTDNGSEFKKEFD